MKSQDWWWYQSGSSFTPTDLGAKLISEHYADGADNFTLGVGNDVTTWLDQSGNSNNWRQTNSTLRPLWDTVDKITFDAADEFLDTVSLASYSSDTQGELIVVWKSLADVPQLVFSVSNNGSNNDWMSFGQLDYTNPLLYWKDSSLNTIDFGTGMTQQFNISRWSSDGTNYYHYLNGVLQSISSGTDNGNWFGDLGVGVDGIRLGSRARVATDYYNLEIKSVLYCNEKLSAEEGTNIDTYLNTKFSVY